MKFFNLLARKSFYLVAISTLSLSLISCNTKRNPDFGDDDAQFYVLNITGDAQPEHVTSDLEVNQVRIKLVACLKNLAGGQIPPNLSFEIHAGAEIQTQRTSKDGCLLWEELHSGVDRRQHAMTLVLARSIVSKNDYTGKRSFSIYWNVKANTVRSNVTGRTEDARSEHPIQESFTMKDIYATKESLLGDNTIQSDLLPPGEDQSHGQNVNVGLNRSVLETKLQIPSIGLEHIKLSQEAYGVDQNLTLYAQHKYKVAIDPQYLVNNFENPQDLVTPTSGRYKITLVFMDDPDVDIEKLTTELQYHQNIESIKNSNSPESELLKLAADDLVVTHALRLNDILSVDSKQKILTKSLIGRVNAVAQFVVDKTPQKIEKFIDLKLKKLASLDVMSVVVVTIENVSTDQTHPYKGNGIGYVKNMLDPGDVELSPTPIAADTIYNEYISQIAANEKIKPFERFLQNEQLAKKAQAIAPLDLSDLTSDQVDQFARSNEMSDPFPASIFKRGSPYPFKQELEAFLMSNKDAAHRGFFLRAVCDKVFVNPDLAMVEKERGPIQKFLFGDRKTAFDDRENLALGCQRSVMGHSADDFLSFEVRDFVVSAEDAVVTKRLRSQSEDIKVSKSFENSITDSQKYGAETGASLGGEFSKFLVSINGKLYYAAAREQGRTKQTSLSQETSDKLSVNIDTYNINIETKRCLIVKFKPGVTKMFADKLNMNLREGYYACMDKTIKPNYIEKYYMITHDCTDSNGTTDCSSDDETSMRAILRGEATYKAFANLITNTDMSLFFDPIAPETLAAQKMQWPDMSGSLTTSQIAPGVLIPTNILMSPKDN
jgi:hypothetical protein